MLQKYIPHSYPRNNGLRAIGFRGYQINMNSDASSSGAWNPKMDLERGLEFRVTLNPKAMGCQHVSARGEPRMWFRKEPEYGLTIIQHGTP